MEASSTPTIRRLTPSCRHQLSPIALHHFQHKDLFADPDYYRRNPIAEYIFKETQLDYPTQVAVRNLLSFQAFTDDIQNRLDKFSVNEFVRSYFGEVAGEAVRTLET